MFYALYVPNFGGFGQAQIVAELAREAEAAGWDGFFLWDHLFADADSRHGPVADPWISLAAIAVQTRRIRLGALVTPFARRRPWKLARETATLDHLSRGRLVVGAGIGGDWWREYSAFGEATDARAHAAMLDEGLDVLSGLWSGEPFSYRGAHYTIDDARFLPPPVQRPRIPIWVAGVWPGTRPFRRAARWDGIVPIGRTGDLTPADIEAMRAYVQARRTTDAPFDVALGGRARERDADDAAAMLARYAAAGVTWWLESFWADAPLSIVQSVIRRGPPPSAGV
jgi:alkanesulfonate monooxygenase SsuD/methylene tetrahydromethanopterin reductase-like flavin-dependent oxidoreductase (luciferase family)